MNAEIYNFFVMVLRPESKHIVKSPIAQKVLVLSLQQASVHELHQVQKRSIRLDAEREATGPVRGGEAAHLADVVEVGEDAGVVGRRGEHLVVEVDVEGEVEEEGDEGASDQVT